MTKVRYWLVRILDALGAFDPPRNRGRAERDARMDDAQRSETTPPMPFDPWEVDCFGRFINKTDDEVSTLIADVAALVDSQGEYDQGDSVLLAFDPTRDLVDIAERLWSYRQQVKP